MGHLPSAQLRRALGLAAGALLAGSCLSVSPDPEPFEELARAAEPVSGAALHALLARTPPAELACDATAVPLASSFGLPAVRACLDGRDTLLLVDTGSRFAYLSARVARVAGLRVFHGAGVRLSFLGERVPARMAVAREIRIGRARWRDVPIFVTLRRTRIHVLGISLHELEGGLGSDLLRSFRVTLDFPARRLLLERGDRPAPEGGAALPLGFLPDGRPAVAVTLNGRGPLRFLLDTCSTQITLASSAAREAGIDVRGARTARTFGFGTRAEVLVARVRDLSLGPIRLRDVPVDVLLRPDPDFRRNGFLGIVGVRALQAYRVTLDFPAGRLVLERP